jgi:HPt (histidine-containing phosphotransfer) domain-containing protein
MEGYEEKCRAAGMDGYLTKPINYESLRHVLAGVQVMPVPAPAPARPQALQASPFDPVELIDRLMGDEELAKAVAEEFIDSLPGQLASLASAIGSSDTHAAKMAAHAIKGSAANMGCTAVRDLAATVEKMSEAEWVDRVPDVMRELGAALETVRPMIQRFCSVDSK